MGVDRPIDITAEQRKTILALLERYLPNTTAWAYGSRVAWTSRPQSDLDMVVFATPEQNDQVADLREAFEESDLPFRVDLFVWDAVPEEFRKRIEAEHVVLVEPGESGGDWREVTLGELLSFSNGKSSPKRFENASNPVYGSNGIIGFSNDQNAFPKTIIIGRVGSYCGSLYYSNKMCWVTDNAIRANALGENYAKFLFYLLKTLNLNTWSTGSGQPLLNQTTLSVIPASVPSPAEQRAIAHILGTLDDKIELNRRMNETLEEMARALFKYWFVDFGPVRAKMEGRWRRGESLPGLPAELYDLFPDRLVDSELGEVPEGWEWSEIGQEVKTVGGATPNTKNPSYWHQGEYHWTTPKDISNLYSPVLLETTRKITSEGLRKISSGILPVGTVLLSSRAPIGYLAITEVQTAVNQGFIAMICNQRLSNLYVLHWCAQNLDYLRNIAGGSTFAEISKKDFRPVPVLVPSQEILDMYERLCRPAHDRLVVNTKESVTLSNRRDSLLPKLVSGDIGVSHMDIFEREVNEKNTTQPPRPKGGAVPSVRQGPGGAGRLPDLGTSTGPG